MTLAITLLVVALVLVMLELAFPSFGLLSLAAATAYTFSLVCAFKEGSTTGFTFIGLGILLLPLAIGFGLKVLPHTPVGRRLFLHGPTADEIQRGTVPDNVRELLGQEGVAITDLRPSGTARISGQRVDVVASGNFVPKGDGVRVTSINGTRVVVQSMTTP